MLHLSLLALVFAAALGLIVAIQIVKKRTTSKPIVLAHGAVGAGALGLLILHATKNPDRLLATSIALLVVAAAGGAVAFVNDLRQKPGPLMLIAIHAAAAVIATVLVLIVALG